MGFAGDIRGALRIGLASVRANAVPMVVLWALAAALAVGYYWIPVVAAVLEPLRKWQGEHEFVGAFVSRVFFCGLVPGVFLLTVKAIRPKKPWTTMVAQALWCGGWGLFYVYLYRWMSEWFGDGPELLTLVKKTAFDMFVWSAFVMIPLNAVFFFWVGHDLSLAKAKENWPRHFVRELVLPNYITNWCIWIPVMMAVYAFPLTLQIHLGGFAGAFWTLVFLYLGARQDELRGSRSSSS